MTLIDKLQVAEVGGRELDFWVAFELGLMADVVRDRPSRVEPGPGDELTIYDAKGKRAGWVGYHVSAPVTTSVDAALALAERVLPGKGWGALYSGLMNWRAHTPSGLQRLPLLVCAAILQAKDTGQPGGPS